MDIDQTDLYEKRKIESDLQKVDYLRSFNKDLKKVVQKILEEDQQKSHYLLKTK
ncbi:hypothetical protein Gotur_015741 [Gossypium turneri]